MFLGEAKTPDDMRLYAIGDVHGCDDLLARAHDTIAADLEADPVGDHRIIHLGDYVDRGPASFAVIDRLARMGETDRHVVSLRGNHDAMMLDFLTDPVGGGAMWLMNGGDKTLANYGVDARSWQESDRRLIALSEQFAETLPDHHRAFLAGLPDTVRFRDFFFCHAGIRPGVPLDAQAPQDLIWIRDDFLTDARDHGVVVVHGHTPQPRPDVWPNHINIDTGAVFGGPLTLLALDGTRHRFL